MRRTLTIATTVAAIVALLPATAGASHLDEVDLICGSTVPDGDDPGGVVDHCQEAAILMGLNVPEDVEVEFDGAPADSVETVPTLGQSGVNVTLGTPADVSEPFTLTVRAGHTAAITAPQGLNLIPGGQDGVFTGTSFPGATVVGRFSHPDHPDYVRHVTAGSNGAYTLNFRSGGGGPTDPDNTGNFTGSIVLGTTLDVDATAMSDGVSFGYNGRRSWELFWFSGNTGTGTTVDVNAGVPGLPLTVFGETSFVGNLSTVRDLGSATSATARFLGRNFSFRLFQITVDEIDLASGTISGTGPQSSLVDVFAATNRGSGAKDVSTNASGAWSTTFADLGIAPGPYNWGAVDAFAFGDHGVAHGKGAVGTPRSGGETPLAELDLTGPPMINVTGLAGANGHQWGYTITNGSGPITGTAPLMVEPSGFFIESTLQIPLGAQPAVDVLGGFDLELQRSGTTHTFDFPPVTHSFEDGVARIGSAPGVDLDLHGNLRSRDFFRSSPNDGDGVLVLDTTLGTDTSALIQGSVRTEETGILLDLFSGALVRPIGAGGGPAYPAIPASPTPGGLWFDSGGPADLASFFAYEPTIGPLPEGVTNLSNDFLPGFEAQLFADGEFTRIPPVPTGLAIGLKRHFTDSDELFVGGWGPNGWETIAPGNVIPCFDFSKALPPQCEMHPGPHLFVQDVPHLTTFVATQGNPAGTALDIARAAGPDRIDTAIELSKAAFADGAADAVIVARDRAFPDALSSVAVAAAANGPVLLNPIEGLNSKVRDEIGRLGATTAYIMGETAAQSQAVQDALVDLLGAENVIRLGGEDRFETAEKAAVAAQDLWQDAGFAEAGTSVLIAKGIDVDETRAWPDALAGGQLAAAARKPILLTRSDSVPAATNRAIDTLGATEVTVLGGPAAVPDETLGQVGAAGTERNRIGGEDRFHTSTLIADAAIGAGATDRDVFVATGRNYPDGLAAGAAAAARGGTLVLVDDDQLTEQSKFTTDWLAERNGVIRWVRVAGREKAIAPAVFDSIVSLLS